MKGEIYINNTEILKEIKEIQKAFEYIEQIKTGELKGRPVEQLLNEI